MKTLIVAALFTFGCSAAGGEYSDHSVSTECNFVFTPTEDIEVEIQLSAERWSNATGCNVTLGYDGIPIHTQEKITNPINGADDYGMTEYAPTRITLVQYMSFTLGSAVALHEMGHAFGVYDHLQSPGIMAEHGGDYMIHDEDLEAVCSVVACTTMTAER